LEKPISGCVFNIQRFSIQDGPGIRSTVFLKGCPLRCLWCSNPESQNDLTELGYRDSVCTGCGNCIKVCPSQARALTLSEGKPKIRIDRAKCTLCYKCVDACLFGAMRVYGRLMTVDEVFDEVKRDSLYYVNSGGGVTASGGEPLMQADFVAELFRRCKTKGIHTTIDTSGYAGVQDLEKVLAVTDLVLFDLKSMNGQQHKRTTEKDNRVILRNARLIIARGISMIIRIPLIPGINDSQENLTKTARFVAELDPKLHVDLLPYHRFGEGKFRMIGKEYPLADVVAPGDEQLDAALEVFKGFGLDCAIQR
jgi:pyruvate formate lyase activating enzyme